ncbi:MAG TPA: ArsA-related P-loop ATPase [Ilumatobacteraceae bacterium]|nr:ArsA-related P-loop ATPase [Ilumatobacteraceae bacterium]
MPPESEYPLQSLTATRVVVVAGKGGVGKTTVTAVIARAASSAGRRVLVVELDGKPALAELIPDIEVMTISPPEALDEYLREHGFARIAKRLNRTGVIDMVGTAAPGIDDIVVLGKIKQLERSGAYDLIVVDGPAAGHAVTFLTSAAGLADSVRSGPVRAQADDVLALLHDHERAQVVLVALAETTPVNEAIETAFALEDQVGVRLGPIVVNAVDLGEPLPDVDESESAVADLDDATAATLLEAAAFRRGRRAMESEEIRRLAEQLPLPQVTLPARSVAGLSAADIDALAAPLVPATGTVTS